MDIKKYLRDKKDLIDAALDRYISEERRYPDNLYKSMNYSVEAGGKRLRPILALSAAEAVGGNIEQVIPLACALEMIHTFSLIHDDLPSMDNDDLRRGIPTNHKVYGEGVAILAGDALLAEAFYCITHPEKTDAASAHLMLEVIRDISSATGPRGMVGGQVIDIESEGKKLDLSELELLHIYKTGRLLAVSVTSGAKLAGATKEQVEALNRYGEAIGLAFQIADDILDIEGSEEEIGKPIGSDTKKNKATFPAIVGMKESKERAAELVDIALEAIDNFDEKANPLRGIAKYIIERRS
jgi:geranylgeranyl diphosphate synthase type II